jgi:hypothetical protein
MLRTVILRRRPWACARSSRCLRTVARPRCSSSLASVMITCCGRARLASGMKPTIFGSARCEAAPTITPSVLRTTRRPVSLSVSMVC